MFIDPDSGATASTGSAEPTPAAEPSSNVPYFPALPPERVRHMLFGPPSAVQATIQQLHQLGYAEPNDWSRQISTGRANEVMAILTKRIEAVK